MKLFLLTLSCLCISSLLIAQSNIHEYNGNVGVGITQPADKFVVSNNGGEIRFGGGNGRTLSAYNEWGLANFDFYAAQTYFDSDFLMAENKKISTSNTSTQNLYLTTHDVTKAIYTDRKVAIGTIDPGAYMLAVNGDAIFNKIRVKQYPWADYVFEPSYNLLTLNELEAFIKVHKHLPDVPTATEVETNGADIGDNQVLLLKKVEELTLYIIDQNKKLQELEKKVADISGKR